MMKFSNLNSSEPTTLVCVLTVEQKDEIANTEFALDSYFNPIQDINGNWIISVEEIRDTNLQWIKDLDLIEYQPVINEPI